MVNPAALQLRPLLALGLGLALACAEAKTTGPGGVGVDAGTAGGDGGQADAGATGRITVRVLEGGTAQAGIPLIVSDSAGDFIALEDSTTSGELAAPIPADAMLTALYEGEEAGQYFGVTYVGVQPGDTIELGTRTPEATVTAIGDAEIEWPEAPEGTIEIVLDDGCEAVFTATTGPETLGLDSSCVTGQGRFDVLAVAVDEDELPIAWATATDVMAVQGDTARVRLGAWSTEGDRYRFRTTGLPGDAVYVAVDPTVRRGGHSYLMPGNYDFVIGTELEIEIVVPRGFGDGLRVDVSVGLGDDETAIDGLYFAREWASGGPSGPVELAVGADLLPPVRELVAELPRSEPARPSLRWRIDGTPTSADGLLLYADFAGPGARLTSWTAVVPPGHAGPFVLPTLPDAYADWRPADGARIAGRAAYLVGGPDIEGWDVFRQTQGADVFELEPTGRDWSRAVTAAGDDF